MAASQKQEVPCGPVQCYPIRVHPGEDIVARLKEFVRSQDLKAAFILTAVGSVTSAHLRLADENLQKTYTGKYEIVSLVGTLSGGDPGHLHISLSDAEGHVVGGHVYGELTVYTTAEVMVGNCAGVTLTREMDQATGFDELVINKS